MSVLIGNVNPGMVSSSYMRSIMNFMLYDMGSDGRHELHGYLPWLSSSLIDIYRNMIVEQFLVNTDHEWLWFIDSDVVIDNTTLYTLLDVADPTARPVVSGLYGTIDSASGKVRPSMWYLGKDDDNRTTMLQYDTIPDDKTVEVDGVGAGCLLLHRSLLEAMRFVYPPAKPWFDMGVFDGVPFGEDYTFCMRVKQMGFPITVASDALVQHEKTVSLRLDKEVLANDRNS